MDKDGRPLSIPYARSRACRMDYLKDHSQNSYRDKEIVPLQFGKNICKLQLTQ